LTTPPYTYIWTNIAGGIYNITAVATNILGHSQKSSIVKITVGTPPMVRLEAEAATRTGPGMSIVTDPIASGGKYMNIASNDSTTKITWTLNNVPTAGNYPIAFGFKLNAGTPKSQFINVNGVKVLELEFTATSPTTWYERDTTVNLLQGSNTIQMQMSWGWMAVDYLAVPRDIITSVERSSEVPLQYSLYQNYPNPFNPTTSIKFDLVHSTLVKIEVFDILGRCVSVLSDEYQTAGTHIVPFDGRHLTSGIYFVRMHAGDYNKTNKMVLMK
jgi:hypothetical protein